MTFTINDLKKHLGPGLGLRKNKYLIEIPVPGIEGRTLNILCRSAGLPERNISTTTIHHKGRKYQVRGETDYGSEYEISVLDDSDMKIRQIFDKWAEKVDKSKPNNAGILGSAIDAASPGLLDNIKSGIELIGDVKDAVENPALMTDFFLGFIDQGGALSAALYQTDINIWQLNNEGDKVYGYTLQNAFPKQVGIVTLDDGDENTMSEFSVTFAFSEFSPIYENKISDNILGTVLGDDVQEIRGGVEALYE